MKLLSKSDGRLVFEISSVERDSILDLLGLTESLPQQPRPVSNEAHRREFRAAQEDLDQNLSEYRASLRQKIEGLLRDPARCVPKDKSFHLTLERNEAEMFLQMVNGLRLGAWHRLGCPDFEAGDKPELTPEVSACVAVMRATDYLLSQLLDALEQEP